MAGATARALYVGRMPATAYPTGSATCAGGRTGVGEGRGLHSDVPRLPWTPPCCSGALFLAHPADVVRVIQEGRGAVVPDEQARSPAEDRHHLRAALRRLLPNLRGATEQNIHSDAYQSV